MELKSEFENTPQEEEEEEEQQQQEEEQQQQQQRDENFEKHQQQEQQEQKQQKQKHIFHVLAVDDSLIDRKLLEKLLRISSYQVTCVDSGDKALEYLGLLDNLDKSSSASASASAPASASASAPASASASAPASASASASASAFSTPHSSQQEGSRVNLIMTDFCMPGMSGYDLLKRVKGSSWRNVPVVVMSSENVPSRISMCLEEGAEEFLLKPLRLSDLDKLEAHLLKSLNHENEFNPSNNENRNNMENNNNNNNNNDINNFKSNNNNNNNNAFSKRKALDADTQERRPKMKELAVV